MQNTKPIPKSLHTVRVLVIMARQLMQNQTIDAALNDAISLLGYENTPDSHGLREKAFKQLNGSR